MVDRPQARNAYVQAEVATSLAHQIRAIRIQRGWTQAQLAELIGTKQTIISRLENPEYGRASLKVLVELSRVFDTGLQVRFVPLVTMLQQTFIPDASAHEVPSFEDEAPDVDFYDTNDNHGVDSRLHLGETTVIAFNKILPCKPVVEPLLCQPNSF